jgi:hypothetical protein
MIDAMEAAWEPAKNCGERAQTAGRRGERRDSDEGSFGGV